MVGFNAPDTIIRQNGATIGQGKRTVDATHVCVTTALNWLLSGRSKTKFEHNVVWWTADASTKLRNVDNAYPT